MIILGVIKMENIRHKLEDIQSALSRHKREIRLLWQESVDRGEGGSENSTDLFNILTDIDETREALERVIIFDCQQQ